MNTQRHLLVNSLFFVLGFSIVFISVGVLIEYFIAQSSYLIKQYLSYVGAGIIMLFGLALLGVFRIPFLSTEHRFAAQKTRNSYVSSALFGFAFGAGWSPCVGAILGAIVTLAATQPVSAFVLMLAYSLGIGIPFLLATLFIDQIKSSLGLAGKRLRYIQKFVGGLLLLLGILIVTNHLVTIFEATFSSEIFSVIDNALASQGVGIGVAFIAGIVSFLSPCVLPLLPVYVAYLASVSLQSNK